MSTSTLHQALQKQAAQEQLEALKAAMDAQKAAEAETQVDEDEPAPLPEAKKSSPRKKSLRKPRSAKKLILSTTAAEDEVEPKESQASSTKLAKPIPGLLALPAPAAEPKQSPVETPLQSAPTLILSEATGPVPNGLEEIPAEAPKPSHEENPLQSSENIPPPEPSLEEKPLQSSENIPPPEPSLEEKPLQSSEIPSPEKSGEATPGSATLPTGPSAAASFGGPPDPYFYNPSLEDAQDPYPKSTSSLKLQGIASCEDAVSPQRPRQLFEDVILDVPASDHPLMKALNESPQKALEEPEMRDFFARLLVQDPSTPKSGEKLKAIALNKSLFTMLGS